MMIESPQDLDVYLSDFGLDVTFGAEQFRALFENAYGEGLGVEGTVPVLTCKSSDIERVDLVIESTIEFDGEAWMVESIRGDGTGISQVFLSDAT